LRPGDEHELSRLAADVISRRLDRDRPLCEIWIIEGRRQQVGDADTVSAARR
jgi:hypothetical protein